MKFFNRLKKTVLRKNACCKPYKFQRIHKTPHTAFTETRNFLSVLTITTKLVYNYNDDHVNLTWGLH